jgi:carbamoyltransferase
MVLGIHVGLDSGAAIVEDGRVLAAISEERIRNEKHYFGFPEYSIAEILRISRKRIEDIDLIAFGSYSLTHDTTKGKKPIMVTAFEWISPYFHNVRAARAWSEFLGKCRHKSMLRFLRKAGVYDREIVYLDHHATHASGSYRLSPFGYDEQVLALTCDGIGDGVSATVNLCEEGEIRRIAETSGFDSLGIFYSAITAHLGMRPFDHEYKVMGLAPYGRWDYGADKERPLIEKMRSLITLNPNNGLQLKSTSRAWGSRLQRKLLLLLEHERFDNVAAAAQKHLEDLLVLWVEKALKRTGVRKVVTGGGTFLNVKANKLMREKFPNVEFFFNPICDDAGLAVEAALEGYAAFCKRDGKRIQKTEMGPLYWGSEWTEQDIEKAIRERSWETQAKRISNIEEECARLMVDGFVVARFNGKTEFGPRALGNRSIMADARNYQITRKLNFMVKMRDFWMPFAPSILSERKEDYLINAREAPYMIEAFDTTSKRDELAAALHPYDSTCRPQTVTKEWNPSYYMIIKTWSEIVGVGGILNTSFNLHGYPIVNSPQQALWTMENSYLDYLAMGDWIIKNKRLA